ncbi:MAG: hypothetical protein IPP56_01850 [Bacteroidetes bacterium]|nr:hypothetical protein [Bacteroidota bacterium]
MMQTMLAFQEKNDAICPSFFNPTAITQQFISIYNPINFKVEAGNTREILTIPHSWKVLDVAVAIIQTKEPMCCLNAKLKKTEHRSGAKAVIIPSGKNLF